MEKIAEEFNECFYDWMKRLMSNRKQLALKKIRRPMVDSERLTKELVKKGYKN